MSANNNHRTNSEVNPPVPSSLRLVKPDADAPIPLERRRATRHKVSARVTAIRSGIGPDIGRRSICPLQITNMSDTGLCAMSQDAVELNTPVTIFLPPHGPERGYDLVGHVVRCIPAAYGHELGICFERRMAA